MSNDLTLPFAALGDTSTLAADPDLAAFSITLTAGGGIAIQGMSFGTDAGGDTPMGVLGETDVGIGVQGLSTGSGQGVVGLANQGFGVVGYNGVSPQTPEPDLAGAGVAGFSVNNYGVWGGSASYDGVKGVSNSSMHAGVSGINGAGGSGVYGKGEQYAGYFEGTVHVTKDVEVQGDIILTNEDCAEDFDAIDGVTLEPGSVVVLNEHGNVEQCQRSYDKRAAGVISGACMLKPAIVLGRHSPSGNRVPVALVGKVYCKVDARYSPIEVGDLLTTSPTLGHAMKATDQAKAFGAVIGKALAPLSSGMCAIPILVALQ